MPRDADRDAITSLQTYYNYVSAWVMTLEVTYGDECAAAIRDRQNGLRTFQRLQGGREGSDEVVGAFLRGQLTLRAMETLPIGESAELAATGNLWLPVQSYYAVHGMGIAALAALGQETPKDHRAFRSAFTDALVRLLPYPFSARCEGGPSPSGMCYANLNVSPEEVTAQNNLALPGRRSCAALVGKSLATTRKRTLDELLDTARQRGVRPGRSRRNLTPTETQRVALSLHPTSIGDLLYRMRRRSNYESPGMYLAAFDDIESASLHYRALTRLTSVLCDCLSAIVARKVGRATFATLQARVT